MKQLFLAALFFVSTAGICAEPEDPKVSEGLTAKEVQAVVRENLNQIRHCYEQLLQKSPKAKGKVLADFSIIADGKVGTSKLSLDTVGSAELSGCILNKISVWAFPKPKDGKTVTVSYPFQFDPL